MSDTPLTDAERDSLIRTMTRQLDEAEATIREYERTIRVLGDELTATHKELAALKAGIYPETPFSA